MIRTLCILVLYKPTPSLLGQVVEAIIHQVDKIWISDNTPGGYDGISAITNKNNGKIVYSEMNGNIGIAAAQNAGIKYAVDNEYDFVYFLDQDSISAEGIAKGLVDGYKLLSGKGVKIGGVGPLPINRITGKDYPIDIIGRPFNDNVNIFEARDLMNSASLINVDLFREVGMMDEFLFIDGVDYELCWRATSNAQYRFFILQSIKLSHQLGEGDKRLMGAPVKISTPFRTYYQFRNYFILLCRGYVPVTWKIKNGIKYLCKYFYFPLFCKPRIEYLKNINRGIIDGIKNK